MTKKLTRSQENVSNKINKLGKFCYKERNDILHREDGPAIERPNGNNEYWINRKKLTDERLNGNKHWYKEGKLHREDGPACEYNDGTKVWYKEGKRHRLDGPAIEYTNGDKEYWVDDNQLTEEEFNNSKTSFTKEELKNMSLEELHELVS